MKAERTFVAVVGVDAKQYDALAKEKEEEVGEKRTRPSKGKTAKDALDEESEPEAEESEEESEDSAFKDDESDEEEGSSY